MPSLTKGGKWVFGWVVVGQDRTIRIPPEAWEEYGFQAQDEVIFLRGSGLALGFLQGGLIYEEAEKHPDLEVFQV
jgi:hypothetical protein